MKILGCSGISQPWWRIRRPRWLVFRRRARQLGRRCGVLPFLFLDPEGGSHKATVVVLLVVVLISSLYAAERNETLHTHSCSHFPQICRLRFSTYFLINE